MPERPEEEESFAAAPTDADADSDLLRDDPDAIDPKTAPVVSWDSLGLSEETLQLIEKAGFKHPSPVQAAAIPHAVDGYDVIASAQTGTGKTASFALPMIERIAGRKGTLGLVLAPTREIAQQIQATFEIFGTPRGVRSIVLIGGTNLRTDVQLIQSYPEVIVATPGRLCDHLDRGNLWLDYIEVVVLDEADRMLDMGFSDQLSRIMEEVPKNRQTMLFSATFAPPVEKLARKILYEPKKITIGKPLSAAKTVEQSLIWVKEESKNRELMRILREEKGSVIVFTRSKDGATRVWRSLHSAGVYDATYIHSDRLQAHREQALAEFKEGKYRILIATDVAARGIHVEGVAHVVNYDLPMEPESYIHRIGRTGRAGATGVSTTLATSRDKGIIRQIERLLGFPIPAKNSPPEGRPGEDRSGGDRGHSRGGRDSGRRDSRGGRHSRGEKRGSHGGGSEGHTREREASGNSHAPEKEAPRHSSRESAPNSGDQKTHAPRPSGQKPVIRPAGPKAPSANGGGGPLIRADEHLRAFLDTDEDAGHSHQSNPEKRARHAEAGEGQEGGGAKRRRRRPRRRGGRGNGGGGNAPAEGGAPSGDSEG